MKVLHFAHSFFPVYGGTSTRLSNLLAGKVNEHYLYVPQFPSRYVPTSLGRLDDEGVFDNIKVTRVQLIEKVHRVKLPFLSRLRYIEINSNKLVNRVKEKDVQIVHGHNPAVFAIAAMKKVVLVSDVGGMSEVVIDNENGFVFRKGDKSDLVRKITYLVDNIDNLKNIGEKARDHVVCKYSWQRAREKLQVVYEKVIS